MKDTKCVTLKHDKKKRYTYNENKIPDNGLFPLIEFLIGDYTDFGDLYWDEFFDKGIPIDSSGNTTWIEEKNGKIKIIFLFFDQEEYTTTKKMFFKILEQWDEVVAKRPKKILIQEVDGEILIGPLEDDMN